eukprot:scaffold13829_cov128-Isochrysis_galbana.AAC.2
MCGRKLPHAPERGVGRPPRADPPPSKLDVWVPFLFPRPLYLPCHVACGAREKCACFGAGEWNPPPPPLPPREGDCRVGAQRQQTLDVP